MFPFPFFFRIIFCLRMKGWRTAAQFDDDYFKGLLGMRKQSIIFAHMKGGVYE